MNGPFQLEGSSADPPAGGWHARIWPIRPAGPLTVVMMELIDWWRLRRWSSAVPMVG